MSEKFDKKAYDMSFRKEKKKQFNVDLNPDEKKEIDEFLSEHGIKKSTFIRESFKKIKEEFRMKELLEKYEIESIDEFEPKFYTMNLVNGRLIEKKAIENLYKRGYTKEELIKIENYDEIGIVKFVADDRFYIEDNKIIAEEI